MNKKLEIAKYLISDFLTSVVGWLLFYFFRKIYIEFPFKAEWSEIVDNEKFWLGTILVPLGWIILNGSLGLYGNVFKKSRLKETGVVFLSCIIGALVLFFSLVLDDTNYSYTSYYKSILFLFTAQFILNGFFRFLITSKTAKRVHNRIIGFPTLIVGSNQRAKSLFLELESAKKSAGYQIAGFVNLIEGEKDFILSAHTKHLGDVKAIADIIKEHNIQEIIIAIESKEQEAIQLLMIRIQDFNVSVKIIPDMYNILTGQVKMNSIMHAALIEVSFGTLPVWQKTIKKTIDLVASGFVLLLGAPFYIIVAILVKLSSKGPVFFTQERIGIRGEAFNIIKFRSMYTDAEKDGPALSKDKDSRITPIGRFIRKTRIDETPQFFNVLKGDMSLVGPRPERQFFIDQIVKTDPQYKYLHRVKPGITSWGQVKYGYAENVEEMIERLKFDLIYMENMSILIDFKIMIHTILVVIQGRGK
jgi:exopolysaccharide biosynthesis polyprenyl glycosylphosphotransferase